MLTATIAIRADALSIQCHELGSAMERIPASHRENALELVLGYLDRLGTDISICQDVSTPSADGSIEVSCSVLLGTDFERLMSALRAFERDGI